MVNTIRTCINKDRKKYLERKKTESISREEEKQVKSLAR